MFSGIVEALEPLLRVEALGDVLTIFVRRPSHFQDIKTGDSISTNGVCLTVEVFTDQEIQFTLGAETLRVTGWTADSLQNQLLNLERSLKFGDRVHGHFVSGHVDTTAEVISVQKLESWDVVLKILNFDRRCVWKKGSISLGGVSLTVNEVQGDKIHVCLIPETILRTNLQFLKTGDFVNVEYDSWAKAFVHYQEQRDVQL